MTEILTGALVVPICVFTEPEVTEMRKVRRDIVNRSPLRTAPDSHHYIACSRAAGTVTVMLVVLHALAAPAETPLNVTVLLPWLVPKLTRNDEC